MILLTIDNLKKELLSANRLEGSLTKKADKVEREKEVQLHATIRAEQRTKEQSDLMFDQQRTAAGLAKEVYIYVYVQVSMF
jgi:hypothetical protein